MRKEKMLWTTVLVVSIIFLVGYSIWGFTQFNSRNLNPYDTGYYGRGMMDRWSNNSSTQSDNGEKLSIDQIETVVSDYIEGYSNKLELSDMFVYKDTDYYVSVEEKDSGKGAMELLVNPYTGEIYPEYGPNMMWNEKYRMHGGRGMMGHGRWNNFYGDGFSTKQINNEQAVGIADQYVKQNFGEKFSVNGEGHEFYGYYTLHITQNNNTVGMLSVNYSTGDVWYHDWHGELEQVISDHKQ